MPSPSSCAYADTAWMSRETISIAEAARIIGVSRTAAYDAVHRGELPSLAIGRRLLVPTTRLRALLGHFDGSTQQG